MIASQRPKYLDLYRIRLPLPALVSILHRISGTALFVFAWALLYLLQESVHSQESHLHFQALIGHWLVKMFLIGMLWSFLHHFCAGLRHVLLDIQVAGDLGPARATSWAVLAISLALTAILGAMLW
jgi:succinate dehydrogenase / fumarate reductase, cytochrome b subunit